jgi:hypothetical protein
VTDLHTPDSLLKTLHQAVKRPTPEEFRAQSVSFIMGSVGPESGITRAKVERGTKYSSGSTGSLGIRRDSLRAF